MFDLVKTLFVSGALFLIAAFLLSISASGQTSESWQKVVENNDGFNILMPKAPTTSGLSPSSGPKMLMYTSTDGNITYMVVTTGVTAVDWEKATSRDKFIEGFEQGACEPASLDKNKCEVTRTREFRYKNFPAVDFKVAVNNVNVGVGRIVFAGQKTYTLMTTGVGIDNATTLTQKFLESFELTYQPSKRE